ncbi:hypothetical protein GCM10010921_05690 [Microbacterium album]|uniref:Uncharacterized protein n=1 Tax=Microbacterium album TaxID=2053191 RepID=A0A917IBX8_9MICO|nr:hypothetical protein GCM10010921_05690 [Microbacterium album]
MRGDDPRRDRNIRDAHHPEHVGDEPLPDREIHLRDSFGTPGEPIGGVTGLALTPEAALAAFLSFWPELETYPLVAVRSDIAPPSSTYEWA